MTAEDEERRRRRRERNKIAATKCRLKKRERTANLIHESETLETQNIDLKSQLQELRSQERMLLDVLTLHRPQCQHNIGPATKESIYKLPPVGSVIEQHSYSRPGTVNATFRSHESEVTFETCQNSVSLQWLLVFLQVYSSCTNTTATNGMNYSKAPSIIVQDMEEYDQEYIDLDSINPYLNYASSPCHNYPSNQNYGNNQGMDNGCMA